MSEGRGRNSKVGPVVIPEGRDYAAARMRPSTISGEAKVEKKTEDKVSGVAPESAR